MERLDKPLEEERMELWFWQHPGSGPSAVELPTREYAATVRELFENLDWDDVKVLTEEEQYAAFETPFSVPGMYSITIMDHSAMLINCGLNRSVIGVGRGEEYVCFQVGGAEKLCEKLTDITPSVYVNMGRTRVPAQETPKATLKLYLETALERTKELGHITDYELRDYQVITWSEEKREYVEVEEADGEEEYPDFGYTATYAYKLARPESVFRQQFEQESTDGWVVVTDFKEGLYYDERDGCYGMS